jgi:hypothetical protein
MNPQIKRFAFAMLSLFAFSVPAMGSEERDKMMDAKAAPSDAPIITNRAVTKAGKFSVVGPIVGFSDRRDLYDHHPASLGVRRYFSENHAWEIARVNYEMYSLTAVASGRHRQHGLCERCAPSAVVGKLGLCLVADL